MPIKADQVAENFLQRNIITNRNHTSTVTQRWSVYTVELVYSGHPWDTTSWLLYRGGLLIQWNLYIVVILGTQPVGCYTEVPTNLLAVDLLIIPSLSSISVVSLDNLYEAKLISSTVVHLPGQRSLRLHHN